MIRHMPNQRKCIVTLRDHEGVEHAAELVAESLYEAAALAIHSFVVANGAERHRSKRERFALKYANPLRFIG